jgi:hypothetical protein
MRLRTTSRAPATRPWESRRMPVSDGTVKAPALIELVGQFGLGG